MQRQRAKTEVDQVVKPKYGLTVLKRATKYCVSLRFKYDFGLFGQQALRGFDQVM